MPMILTIFAVLVLCHPSIRKKKKGTLVRLSLTLPIWGLGNRVNMCTASPTRRYIGRARRNVSKEQRTSQRRDSMNWS